MKVLISIKPYYVFLIIAHEMGWDVGRQKTVEVRKDFPKNEDWDKCVKIYCTKDKRSFKQIPKEYQPKMEKFLGKVIGEFVCDKLVWVISHPNIFAGHNLFHEAAIKAACLTYDEAEKYAKGKDLYGWHISDLKIEKLTDISKFTDKNHYYLKKPPQSWCYVTM